MFLSGEPIIISLRYDRPSQTLTCMSIGGPTTNITWIKSGKILRETKYQLSQVILDTRSALYQNTLTLSGGEDGTFICTLENNRGHSHAELTVKGIKIEKILRPFFFYCVSNLACTDGEAMIHKDGRHVEKICSNGSYQIVEGPPNANSNVNTITALGVLIGLLIAFLLLTITVSIIIHWNTMRGRKDNSTLPE